MKNKSIPSFQTEYEAVFFYITTKLLSTRRFRFRAPSSSHPRINRFIRAGSASNWFLQPTKHVVLKNPENKLEAVVLKNCNRW